MKCICTVFAMLLVLISVIAPTAANETDWMPDANLRTAVRSALDIDAGDTLTQADMEDLTSFTAKDSQISSITGLAHATNLTSLDLRDNSIASISALSGLTSLETLKLKGNSIDNISALSNLTGLTLLNLKGNDIVTITVLSGLTNLEHLRLDGNSITDVQPLTSLVDLEKLWISGNALTNAHLLSSLTNLTTIDITIPDPPDTTAPTVEISVPSGTQNSAFDATITFTEMVSDFVQADLSLSGTATASITDWDTTDNTVFTAEITPTTSGTVTLNIAADVATDAANNGNTAATQQSVTVDVNMPSVSIFVVSIVKTGPFTATITFSESVSNFVQGDVSLSSSATASITSWSANSDNTVFTATITPTTSGTVTLDIAADVATDAANNGNTAATTITATVDLDGPSVNISVPSDPQNDAFNAGIIFSEPTLGFVHGDLSLSGTASASITNWSGRDTFYIFTITPTTSGTVILDVPASVATDPGGNPNTAATQQIVTVDIDAPSVSISVPSGTQTGAFDATITFSESVSDFVQGDASLSGTATASITAWNTTDDTVYTATITPTTSGTVTLDIDADVAPDAAGNPNTTATSRTVTVTIEGPKAAQQQGADTTAPDVSISVPSGTQNSAFDATITFTESVSNFVQGDVSLSGTATASITNWSANSDNPAYTATITPTTSGTVILDIAANVATDAANNGNTVATTQTVTVTIQPVVVQQQVVDTTAPDVSISVPSGTQNSAFDAIITFTEAVSGFAQADVSLSGTATASITAWSTNDNTVFTATITPTTSGTVTIDIAADVATDAANNGNTAAVQQSVTVDVDAPSVILTLLPEAEDANHNRIDVEITFSEPVEGFESTDVSITTNGLTQLERTNPPPVASITGWTPNSDGKTYTVYITTHTKTDGQVIFNVPADVATDIAGNPNIAGSELSVDEAPGLYVFITSVGTNGSQGSSRPCHYSNHYNPNFLDILVLDILDINEDGTIDENDVALVQGALGQVGDGILNPRTDINCDNVVNDTDLAFVDDDEGPTCTISAVPTVPQNRAFDITVTFNEYVFDFDTTDVSFAGSTTTATVSLKGVGRSGILDSHSYAFVITPAESGDLVISVPAEAATDALGNQNTASDTHTVTIDMEMPTVTLTSTVPTVGSGVFTITSTFSEAVSDFVQEDLALYGTANPSITAWETTDNTVFTATITPASSGRVYYSVPAGVATDADDKSNTASNRYSREIDLDPPTVTVSVPTDTQTGAFDVTIRFNESIHHDDFEQDDVSLADSTADATITDWEMVAPLDYWLAGKGRIETRSVYEATITPTTSGTVVITIPADVATDEGGNGNTASEAYSITVNLAGGGNAPSAILSGIMNLLDTTPLESLDLEQLEAQLDILRAQSDGSAEYLQAIALLENTLATMRPDKTQLLTNYPNPFNPETWIPYHLANPSNVRITIYNTRGVVVRQLDLGHQREGYYTNRSRAAYWDGRNDFGESVASGIYFYQLEADNISILRKMLILK